MTDFVIKKVVGYSTKSKYILITSEGEPICFTQGKNLMNRCLQYIHGMDVEIEDGAVRKELDKYRTKH